jgi:hypothetical protein
MIGYLARRSEQTENKAMEQTDARCRRTSRSLAFERYLCRSEFVLVLRNILPFHKADCHMNNHILVFYDREGNERFFLRRKATTLGIQRYLLCFAFWGQAESPSAKLEWELRF